MWKWVNPRRQQLCLQHISKLRSNPCNPAVSSVAVLRRMFIARPNSLPHLVSECFKIYLTRKSTTIVLQYTRLLTSSIADDTACISVILGPTLKQVEGFSYCFTIKIQHFCLNTIIMVILALSLRDQRLERL